MLEKSSKNAESQTRVWKLGICRVCCNDLLLIFDKSLSLQPPFNTWPWTCKRKNKQQQHVCTETVYLVNPRNYKNVIGTIIGNQYWTGISSVLGNKPKFHFPPHPFFKKPYLILELFKFGYIRFELWQEFHLEFRQGADAGVTAEAVLKSKVQLNRRLFSEFKTRKSQNTHLECKY